MRQKIIFVVFSILLTSCATLVTRRYHDMKISAIPSNTQIVINDSIYKLPYIFSIRRSKKDLPIKIFNDSLTKNCILKSSPNPAFLYGNLLWVELCPVAYLIDFTNQKRFYYGKSLNLNLYDTVTVIRPPAIKGYYNYFHRVYSSRKGQINLRISLPYINSFYLQPKGEGSKSNIGFWGISGGLEYFYQDNKYLGLSAFAISDFFLPIPAASGYDW